MLKRQCPCGSSAWGHAPQLPWEGDAACSPLLRAQVLLEPLPTGQPLWLPVS